MEKKISLALFEAKPQNKKYKTVGQLVEYLKTVNPDLELSCTDADIGGYDVCSRPWVCLYISDNCVSFGHRDYESREALSCEDYLLYNEQH